MVHWFDLEMLTDKQKNFTKIWIKFLDNFQWITITYKKVVEKWEILTVLTS